MIKTRIYLTSGSCVDVQESFNEVSYVMMHSAPTWTFNLKTESGDPVCVARDHVAYFTTREHGEQQKQKTEQTLTYREFFEAFSAVSQGYHACPSSRGGATVVDPDGNFNAELDPKGCGWSFCASARGYLRYEELTLMAELANTPPELREEA